MTAPRLHPQTDGLNEPGIAGRGELCLLVIGDRQFATHWLPESGQLVIGRGAGCDLVLEDPSVASRHATLHMGPTLRLQDLGSDNITKVRNQPVPKGATVDVAPNELISLGSVMMVVQKRANAPSRRIWTHGYFETRLEEECLRSERFKSTFALVRAECKPGVDPEILEACISKALRLVDVVGAYGPGVYQVLLNDTNAADAQRVADRLRDRLGEVTQVRVGLACHPRDGRSADELSAKVGNLLHESVESVTDPESGTMGQILQLVERVAASTINVLILGETGVGKEKLALLVHKLSPRASKPFLGLNGAALSESLLESELFGHERGAFTGAVQTKLGLLEAAEGGTVFLDEVGELPMSIQAKLLRVLETRQVLRVGSVKPKSIDVRFVAATNADLEGDVARGRFRQDLFFRLNGVALMIPPLRERRSEIPELANAFVIEACRKYGRSVVPVIADEAHELMRRYRWPGNIRELRNIVERAVVICDDKRIDLRHLPVEKLSATFTGGASAVFPNARNSGPPHATLPVPIPLSADAARDSRPPTGHLPKSNLPAGPRSREDLLEELKAVERQRIVDALSACVGNQTRAAEVLGISRRTLVNRMIALGIPGPRRRRDPPPP